MPKYGVRSKGCSLCRQRRIKCDETTPSCSQCRTTGRTCPGPITGIIVRDMTSALSRTTSTKVKRPRKKILHDGRDAAVQNPSSSSSGMVDELDELAQGIARFGKPRSIRSRIDDTVSTQEQINSRYITIERLGASIDPFHTLALGKHFSTEKLINHCTQDQPIKRESESDMNQIAAVHVLGDSLISLGPGDPMQDLLLPKIFSDQLLLQCILYTASVHMSAIYGLDIMFNVDVVTQRVESLILLNQRLSDPLQAVNDITLTAVLRFLGQVIVCMNVEETKLHLDGIQKMLNLAPSFQPDEYVREILFWSDLIGSALCHTPPRQYTTRPSNRLFCHPMFLNPRSTLGVQCRGFQKILARYSVFSGIIEILHEIRCLATVLHYSHCAALPPDEMFIYKQLCYDVKQRLELLPSLEGSPIFECCRLAVMVFAEHALLDDGSNMIVLALGIKTALHNLQMEETMHDLPELMLWILFMGNVASAGTDNESWFRDTFARALSMQKLYHLEAVKRILIEFLWIQVVLDQRLESIWANTEELLDVG